MSNENNNLGSYKAELSDSTIKETTQSHDTILSNINKLQSMETSLYKELEKAYASGDDKKKQASLVNKINELSKMRTGMFKQLDTMYKSIQGRVSQGRIDLVDQLTASGVIEQQLNQSKSDLNKMEANKDNKMRLTEINTYYSEKFQAQTSLLKIIIVFCIPLLILAILGKKNILPGKIVGALTGIIILVGAYIIIKRVIDINSRDNMNFQEYNWNFDPNNYDPTVVDYDMQQLQSATSSLEDDLNSAADNIGMGCVGAACCTTGMYFDSDKGECIIGKDKTQSTTEGFTSSRPAVSYVEVERTPCPFKKGKNNVSPFNKYTENYVKV